MNTEVRDRDDPPPAPAQVVVLVLAGLILAGSGVAFVIALVAGSRVTAAGTALAVGAAAGALIIRRASAAATPHLEAVEPRHIGEEGDGAEPPVIGRASGRRTLLTGTLIAGAGAVLASLLAPLASMGPRRATLGTRTGWAAGVRLVDEEGAPLRVDDVPPGGLSTTWPEGSARPDIAAVVLVRLAAPPQPPTRPEWVVDDELVAYSKICTHMGCPVGLLQEGEGSIFCPCHQARFDAGRGAVPVFGPPGRPLPQLPLGVDADGYLVARDDFPEEVGPTHGRSTPDGRPRGSA